MKNSKKSLISLVLALLMLAGVFTGCGKKNEEAPSSEQQSEQTGSSEKEETTESTTEETTQGKPKDAETIGAIVIVDKAAYEYYNFVQSTADNYVSAINNASSKLSGKAQVYSVVIPTSIDVTLDDATRASISTDDQQKAINYLYGTMNQSVKIVDLYNPLREHRDEYIYYRTDHHWTALGAYYGYLELAKALGVTPVDINDFEKVSFGEFLGSFYSDSKKSPKLEKNADELIAYKPNYATDFKFTEKSGREISWQVVYDTSSYPTGLKYSAFAGGDNPYSIVENKDNQNGKSCVVIKESFANAMIPFIAGNYQTVHIIDYRYWNGKLTDFVTKNNVDDVIFMNNISATRNANLVSSLNGIIG